MHPRQKVRLRPEISPKFSSILGPNPARTRPEKPGPTNNSEVAAWLEDLKGLFADFWLWQMWEI